MSRARRIVSATNPYHVTARCINKDWFRLPLEEVWETFENYLFFIHHAYEVKIHAFVLMSNHYHLMISTPKCNLSEAMRYLMTEVSRSITRQSSRINQTFGGPYFAGLIDTDTHCRHVYKYIYRNPVMANLADKVEVYPYSTLQGLVGFKKLIIPIVDDLYLFENTNVTLQWLNKPYTASTQNNIRLALKKPVFTLPKTKSRKHNLLE